MFVIYAVKINLIIITNSLYEVRTWIYILVDHILTITAYARKHASRMIVLLIISHSLQKIKRNMS